VEARNVADSAVYGAEKFLRDNGDKIPETNRAAVQSEIDAVKAAMAGGDPATMTSAAERLQQALQQAGAAMYQQARETSLIPGRRPDRWRPCR
jgi:molecular chaperone DnaK